MVQTLGRFLARKYYNWEAGVWMKGYCDLEQEESVGSAEKKIEKKRKKRSVLSGVQLVTNVV